MRLLFLLLAAGCDPKGDDTAAPADTAAADTDTDTSPDLPDTDTGLSGTYPDAPKEAPTFTATSSDGAARSREDLLGHPTVMWFFPAAGTYG